MIIGLIEHDGNSVAEASLQMLAFARDVGRRTDNEVVALIIGKDAASVTVELGRHGVSRAVFVAHDQLGDYAPSAWAKAVVQIMADRSPQVVMAAATDRGNEVMAHLAAISDLPMAANCSAAEPGDPFRVTRFRWGGSLLEEAILTGGTKLLTVALHVAAAEEVPAPAEPAVETFVPDVSEKDLRVRLSRREAEITQGVTLKTAPVVIGGGRGVGSAEGYAVLEELAGFLGGAVGCSRVATNNGWRPHSDQVGLTGTRISPKLYVACGISGSIQHLVGCKGSKQIMVVNNDPEAAFFAKADFGVVGDLHQVIPAIVAELKKQGS